MPPNPEQPFVQHYAFLKNFARKRFSFTTPHDLEDLLQETFRKAYEFQNSFCSQRSSVTTWLANILLNTWIDEQRKKKAVILSLDDCNDEPAYKPSHEHSFSDELTDALSVISERNKLLLELHYLHGYRYKELSEIFDLKPGSIKVILTIARRKLRLRLTNRRKTLKNRL